MTAQSQSDLVRLLCMYHSVALASPTKVIPEWLGKIDAHRLGLGEAENLTLSAVGVRKVVWPGHVDGPAVRIFLKWPDEASTTIRYKRLHWKLAAMTRSDTRALDKAIAVCRLTIELMSTCLMPQDGAQ